MNHSKLWGDAAFRRISLVLAVDSVCSWMLVAALPLVVATRFGAGAELVGSLALRRSSRRSYDVAARGFLCCAPCR